MREATGGAYLFQIVILFVLLFTGYISLSVNYSRAFAVSNEITSIIERHNGYTRKGEEPGTSAQEQIEEYLSSVGYRSKGTCDAEEDGEGYLPESSSSFGDSKNYFCLKKVYVIDDDESSDQPIKAYYRVKVFFKLDLPVLSSLFEFEIKSTTKTIFYPIDSI